LSFLIAKMFYQKIYSEEEDDISDYAPAGEMHPMYQVTRVSWIISSAATCAQRTK